MKKIASLIILAIFILACSPAKKETAELEKKEDKVLTEATVFTTAYNSEFQLEKTGSMAFGSLAQPLETETAIFVNPHKKFQTFLGIGGAITDASAEVYAELPADKQAEIMKAYYDKKEGIAYSLARTNIHSCDFSSGSYTYIEEGDSSLSTFSIAHDMEYKIPMIKKAIETAGGELTLYGSPWSPPAFMKDSKNMLYGGKLLKEYYPAWAKYYTKFIEAYEAEGMPVWGISIQNEPMATQTWESCIFTAEEERDFLRDHLGPVMEEAGLGNKKIIVLDHNRDLLNHRVNTILEDPEAAKYAWGVGFHWYEDWTGGEQMYNNIGNVNESYPDKALIFTEGCNGAFDESKYQFWPHAERYGMSMINDFNNGTVAWTDWNILLDETGGPNHVGNFCFAPIHADLRTNSVIYTPSYYYIGHFSKFIKPNAKRISTVSSRSSLLSTSFMNEDQEIVTVVMNPTENVIEYKLYVGDSGFKQSILPHAIQTLVY